MLSKNLLQARRQKFAISACALLITCGIFLISRPGIVKAFMPTDRLLNITSAWQDAVSTTHIRVSEDSIKELIVNESIIPVVS